MRLIILAALLIFQSNLFGQLGGACSVMGPQDSTEWGIGVIKWESDTYFKGTDRQNRKFAIGQTLIRFDNATALPIKRADLVFAGNYGNQFFKVFEVKNTLYKVLSNSIEGGLWVNFDELNSKGLVFNTYYSILFNDNPDTVGPWRNRPGSLGVNLFKSCLNVRAEASTDSKVIACISKNVDDRKFHRFNIEYHDDNGWAFIVVQEYVIDTSESGEGCHYKIQSELRGWARAIDEKGYPNIWFSVTNY
jgi:hypothetical protein